MTALEINSHLEAGGVCQVTTYLKSTLYDRRHAGWFSAGQDGSLYVRHGKGRIRLSSGARLLVGIRLGNIILS